jgi:hypothetical protein
VGWLSWLGWLGWLGRAGAGLRQAGAAVRPRPCRRPQPGDKPICVERRQLKDRRGRAAGTGSAGWFAVVVVRGVGDPTLALVLFRAARLGQTAGRFCMGRYYLETKPRSPSETIGFTV